ncbi:protein phosphatase inhibitor 2-like [Dipodomys spectabilis]|uniref:protein phosphatase inhibitor 2-like n=1 Tax=Dipodomys spectabilis TaxID=105255 RepID=UPI001C53DB8B|nr:protein phosphatase inhibitor 2-like [Dipodomys spectabilis]
MATSAASQPPLKGILKNKTSGASTVGVTPQESRQKVEEEMNKKSQKWDEMNILATYHPAGKDYGFMKVDEPGTPYFTLMDDDPDVFSDPKASSGGMVSPALLAQKLSAAVGSEPKFLLRQREGSSTDEEGGLSPQDQEKREKFETQRKLHYSEGLSIKLARRLLSQELFEDDDEDVGSGTAEGGTTSSSAKAKAGASSSSPGSTSKEKQRSKSPSS